jgi:hypothetical protein
MAASLPNEKSGFIVFRGLLERSHAIIRCIPIQAVATSQQHCGCSSPEGAVK